MFGFFFGLLCLWLFFGKWLYVVFVFDIGFMKIVCMIGKLMLCFESEVFLGCMYNVEIFGIGYYKLCGVKNGVIIDLEVVEGVVCFVVDVVECMVGFMVESLIVNVFCGCFGSDIYIVFIDFGG